VPDSQLESDRPRRKYQPESSRSSGSPSGNGAQPGLRAAKRGQTFRGLLGNQGLQAGANQSRLLLDARKLPGAFEQLLINNECRPHMHEYEWPMHIRQ